MKSSAVFSLFLISFSSQSSGNGFRSINASENKKTHAILRATWCRVDIVWDVPCPLEFYGRQGFKVQVSETNCQCPTYEWEFILEPARGSQIVKQRRSKRNIFSIGPFALVEFGAYRLTVTYYGTMAGSFSPGNDVVTGQKSCILQQKWRKYDFENYPYGRLPIEAAGPCFGTAYVPFLMTNWNEMYLPEKLTQIQSHAKVRFMRTILADGTIRRDGLLIIPSFTRSCGKETLYDFTIDGSLNDPSGVMDDIVVSNSKYFEPTPQGEGINFRCEMNCGFGVTTAVNIHDAFVLTAISGDALTGEWKWTSEQVNVDDIRDTSTSGDVLSIEEESLPIGQTITFQATRGKASAQYQISTIPTFKKGSCVVVPEEAKYGEYVSLFCDGFDGVFPLIYEIGIKHGAKTQYLISSEFPQQEFKALISGVVVSVSDAHNNNFKIELPFPKVTSKPEKEEIADDLFTARDEMKVKAFEKGLDILSSLTLTAYDNKLLDENVKLSILQLFDQIPNYTNPMIRTGGNIVYLISNFTYLAKSRTIMCLGIVSRLLSTRFLRSGNQRGGLHIAQPDRTTTYLSLLESANEALKLQDPEALPTNFDPHDRTVNLHLVRKGISELVKSIDDLTAEISNERSRSNVERKISAGSTNLILKINSPKKAFNFTKNFQTQVVFQTNMGDQYSAYDKLAVIETVLPEDIFWWLPQYVNTECVLLNLFGFHGEAKAVRLERSQQPFTVKLKVINYVQGNVSGVALPQSVELQPVHKIVFQKNEGSLILVFNKNMIDNKLKVVIQQNEYPDPNLVAMTSSLNETKILFRLNTTAPVPDMVYIAVQASEAESVPYDFKVSHVVCMEWRDDDFDSRNCKELIDSTTESIHCECTHLSEYIARMLLPKQSIDISDSVDLIITWENSYFMVTVMSSLFILKMFGLILACCRDKITMKRRAILLLDNDPRDKYPYLVGFLSSRVLSCQNTALIAFRMHGEVNSTRVHILNDPGLPLRVLKPGSEDWFVLFSPKRLGAINHVEVFTNNAGNNPYWFLLTVTVVDLKRRKTFAFHYNDWISVQHLPPGETLFRIPNSSLSLSWQVLMAANVLLGFRENHRWLRIILRHPRSTFTRAERVSLTYGLLTTSLILSMVFFETQDSGPMDRPNIEVKIEEYVKSIESLLLSAFVLLAIGYFFSLSKIKYDLTTKEYYVLEHLRPKYSLKIRDPREAFISTHLVVTWNIFAGIVENFIFPHKLRPIVVGEPHKYLHLGWWALAWFVSLTYNTTVTVCIMLYGMKYGRNQSYMWLITLFLSVISDVGVIQIAKIILVSFILAYYFKGHAEDVVKMGEVKNFSFPSRRKERNDFFRDSLENRTQDMYKPLAREFVEESAKKLEKNSIRTLYFIQISILMLIIISSSLLVVSFNIRGDCSVSNLIKRNMFERHSTDASRFGLGEIQNKTNLLESFIWSVMPNVHVLSWYNSQPLSVGGAESIEDFEKNQSSARLKGYFKDYSSKLIGTPRLRQQRINPKYSTVVATQFRGYFNKSYNRINFWNEDRTAYGKQWNLRDWGDLDSPKAWTYTNAYSSQTYSIMGETRTFYSGGGYFINLAPNLDETIEIFTDLYMNNWIDSLTRLFVFELNLYTPNSRRYMVIQVITEVLPSGVLTKKIEADTYLAPKSQLNTSDIICFLVIVTMLVCNVPLCYYNYSSRGFTRYIRSLGNILDFVLVLVGIGFATSYLQKLVIFALAFSEFENIDNDRYFSFRPLIENERSMTATFGVFMCIAVCRLSHVLFDAFLWSTNIFSVFQVFVVSLLSIGFIVAIMWHVLIVSLFVCTKNIHVVVLPFVSAEQDGGCDKEIMSILTILWIMTHLIINAAYIYTSLESVINIYYNARRITPIDYISVSGGSTRLSSRESRKSSLLRGGRAARSLISEFGPRTQNNHVASRHGLIAGKMKLLVERV